MGSVSRSGSGAFSSSAPDFIMADLHPSLQPGPFELSELLMHEPPNDWKPEDVGACLLGVVHRILMGSNDDYTFPILELIDSDGLIFRVRCSAVSLRNQMEDLDVDVGSIVSIIYNGKKMSQGGREYKKFTVRKL